MREVTLFWKRHRLALDRVSVVSDIFEKIVFMGYENRTNKVVSCFLRGICKPGKTPWDLNNTDDYLVKEILTEPNNFDPAWMFIAELRHPLNMVSAKVGRLTVKPGSCLNEEGLFYILRGSPLSIKIVTTAARMMLKPDRISATTISQTDFRGNQVISDKQMEVLREAFNSGWYNTPREINLGELADKMDLGRSTVSEHLIKAESTIIEYFLHGDPSLLDDDLNGE
ncbi:MAG: helix-turn-helix domain-containing protein [Euryarchaeota archaeon]|nr:helix-turn-helix domain-containing protein [Euryarchaeota archaeon]